jgi:thiol-disulfide isomerase/thioredoxin
VRKRRLSGNSALTRAALKKRRDLATKVPVGLAMNKTTAALWALLLALSCPSWAAAQITEEHIQAPEISADVWINSPPLTLGELRGKVVLLDFWEYTCINCIRTFPYLWRWNRLYGPLGLVIIGVHTPEFAFARDPKNVADAVQRFGFKFPVAVDSDSRIWHAYHNDSWPAKYLIDKDGGLEYSYAGEGEYAEFERLIQQLLKQANPKLDFSAVRYQPAPEAPGSGAVCRDATPETYLGFTHADGLANPEGYQQLTAASYKPVAALALDKFDVSGQWLAMPENVKHVGTPSGSDDLRLHYRGKSVYLVAGSDDGRVVAVSVTQDGKPLAQNSWGANIKPGAGGTTYLPVAGKRMYYLASNPHFGEHVLDLEISQPGVSFYSFTFGDNCETAFDHR